LLLDAMMVGILNYNWKIYQQNPQNLDPQPVFLKLSLALSEWHKALAGAAPSP
jgi:hypothetical protein